MNHSEFLKNYRAIVNNHKTAHLHKCF